MREQRGHSPTALDFGLHRGVWRRGTTSIIGFKWLAAASSPSPSPALPMKPGSLGLPPLENAPAVRSSPRFNKSALHFGPPNWGS